MRRRKRDTSSGTGCESASVARRMVLELVDADHALRSLTLRGERCTLTPQAIRPEIGASMNCGQCGNEPPADSRYCNMCGVALGGGETHVAEPAGIVQHRWIYIDLFDMKLPAHMQTIDDRSEVA